MMDRACVALDADHFEVMENQVRSSAKSYHEKESLALRAKNNKTVDTYYGWLRSVRLFSFLTVD